MNIPQYPLHPATAREISKGHFWVIKDEFTEKIPADTFEFIGLDNKKAIGFFLHDPTHNKVKARLWTKKANIPFNLEESILSRLQIACKKRKTLEIDKYRNHYYLVFGEIDELPGLNIIKLNHNYIIQTSAFYWTKFKSMIVEFIQTQFFQVESVFYHERSISYSKQEKPELCWGEVKENFVQEYNYKMKTFLGESYDYGVYTDMSSIRNTLKNELFKSKKVLNLFCYTGAFSLFAEFKGANEIVSVDSFKKVLNTLEENISLSFFNRSKHTLIHQPCEKYFQQNEERFDLIICDPPSSYSVKGKRKKSIDFYKQYLREMDQRLKQNGHLLLYLNTHSVKYKKFEQTVIESLKSSKNKYRIVENYELGEDCPKSEGFSEGNYLKGILVQKVN